MEATVRCYNKSRSTSKLLKPHGKSSPLGQIYLRKCVVITLSRQIFLYCPFYQYVYPDSTSYSQCVFSSCFLLLPLPFSKPRTCKQMLTCAMSLFARTLSQSQAPLQPPPRSLSQNRYSESPFCPGTQSNHSYDFSKTFKKQFFLFFLFQNICLLTILTPKSFIHPHQMATRITPQL